MWRQHRLGCRLGSRPFLRTSSRAYGYVEPKDPTQLAGLSGPYVAPRTNMTQQSVLDTMLPKELKKMDLTRIYQMIPPGGMSEFFLKRLHKTMRKGGNPARVLGLYKQYQKREDYPSMEFLVRCMVCLGYCFDWHSFWSVRDRQTLTATKMFRFLASDLVSGADKIRPRDHLGLLYALACLHYRPPALVPILLQGIESSLLVCKHWQMQLTAWPSLDLVIAKAKTASIPSEAGMTENVPFKLVYGEDFTGLLDRVITEAYVRYGSMPEAGSIHDWAQLAYAMTLHGLYDLKGPAGELVLPVFLANACSGITSESIAENMGWAGYHIYMTLYSLDVEKPEAEIPAKKAVPMDIQLKLHTTWLRNILLPAQPQGSERLQLDVDAAFKRTNTQALINCSVGRPDDEQHTIFAGHKLNPGIAFEYDYLHPIAPDTPKVSGVVAHKLRLMRHFGIYSVVVHDCFWSKLTDDQKDEQVVVLRTKLGYIHDKAMEDSAIRDHRQSHHRPSPPNTGLSYSSDIHPVPEMQRATAKK
ncbi:hypothetical protein FOL47_006874 [Perkinsus chesapeaki]|uniref:DUF6832 domain-containing protein n=1 Tax=Perkinsus chesapeaki TaxID=330153 RepID=A0A7J6LP74_PERCH|nr:hypothetical protein FOL47_006874 [Perkinsus chesapeaki]